MKKEVFLAIAIGFALGLVITFGIWTANKSLANMNKSDESTPSGEISNTDSQPSPTAVPNATASNTTSMLAITAPDDEAFSTINSITVSGKTTPGATVVLTYEGDELVMLADSSGIFSAVVDLIAGYNQITATAFDNTGQTANQTITVTYSSAKI
jgi:hypothetical protein